MSDHFERGDHVEFTVAGFETKEGTVWLHGGTVVAIEADDGTREMVHQNKVEQSIDE